MSKKPSFRCPFEEKGRLAGTIIEVTLGDDKTERMVAIRSAYNELHVHLEKLAIRFTMPASLRETCSSNAELYSAILPYQAELLAVDIDMQLFPFLPYQRKMVSRDDVRAAVKSEPRKSVMARALTKLIWESSPGMLPKCVADLAQWIRTSLEFLRTLNPNVQEIAASISNNVLGENFIALSIQDGAVAYWLDEHYASDPSRNLTKFGIVKSPFYPEEFGRHSENIEIVVSRNVDVRNLPNEIKRSIRFRANAVHSAHGVKIEDLYETQQPVGVWVPKFE